MVYILLEKHRNKRVKLLNGQTTPAFEYPIQASKYADDKGIFNCRIKKV